MNFLALNMNEINKKGIDKPDFVIVTGDAYVDHPSFGTAVIGRVLESRGYSVGIISQPDWNNISSFDVFGKPKYGFLVTSGNIDSMVNHYTVAKKRRNIDYYSPGGKMGLRPDRATIVYSNKIRELYKDVPIILGGIEASLRRLAHYDYWSDSLRRSCLLDAGADLLVYGMGEKQIIQIAESFESGLKVEDMIFIRGTVYKTKKESDFNNTSYIQLPFYTEIKNDKKSYAESFRKQFENTDPITGKVLIERYGNICVVQNPPEYPLEEKDLDYVHSLKYTRKPHPMYDVFGGVPAIEEVKFSIISNRGCFGSCNFCALTFHQGRIVKSRSHKSILQEAKNITHDPDFKGYIHDVGGPTANFRMSSCNQQLEKGVCKNKMCLTPKPCKNLNYDHKDYLALLRKLRSLPNIKKIFIRSGIRYDYLINDKNANDFFSELIKYHISGQLKIAPEHVSENVLEKMGKPKKEVYEQFINKYYTLNKKYNMKQFVVPYFMSSHPGSDLNSAIQLAEYLRDNNLNPQQVQDFYPTPGTVSTCMYYTGLDPITGIEVYIPKTAKEKMMQRALIQYKLPQNYDIVYDALIKANRKDLIGYDQKCLIKPRKSFKNTTKSNSCGDPKTKDYNTKNKQNKKKTIRNVHKKKNKI